MQSSSEIIPDMSREWRVFEVSLEAFAGAVSFLFWEDRNYGNKTRRGKCESVYVFATVEDVDERQLSSFFCSFLYGLHFVSFL